MKRISEIARLKDADTFQDIKSYYKLREKELKGSVLILDVFEAPYGAFSNILCGDKVYISIFIKKSSRGQGLYESVYREYFPKDTIITMGDCDLEEYLKRKGIPYLSV